MADASAIHEPINEMNTFTFESVIDMSSSYTFGAVEIFEQNVDTAVAWSKDHKLAVEIDCNRVCCNLRWVNEYSDKVDGSKLPSRGRTRVKYKRVPNDSVVMYFDAYAWLMKHMLSNTDYLKVKAEMDAALAQFRADNPDEWTVKYTYPDDRLNDPIGGEYIYLCYNKRFPTGNKFWIDRQRHYDSLPNSVPSNFSRGLYTEYWILHKFRTMWERDKSACVRYITHDYNRDMVTVDVTWMRGRPVSMINPHQATLPYAGRGAGIGYEGSDFVKSIDNVTISRR